MAVEKTSPASSRGFSLRGETAQQWCSNLETAVDGRPRDAEPSRPPEESRILSVSRTGRMQWHVNQFVPPTVRQNDKRQKGPAPTEEEEEHLIYLALYRDKVAQHQAAFENTGGKSLASETSEHVVSEDWRQRPGSRPPDKENVKRSAVHTAAVSTKSASLSQGSVEEHFEAKRLGKLFDEWQALQKDAQEAEGTGLSHSSPRAEGRRRRIAQLEALEKDAGGPQGPASARIGTSPLSKKFSQTPSKTRSTSKGGASASTTSRMLQFHDDASISGEERAEATSSPGGASAALDRKRAAQERRKLERLWTVLTNSKVRVMNLSDNQSNDRERPAPTHVESFPPLNLTKLYAGPWRLDPLKGTGDQQSYSATR
eukprot:TRINITY_DN60826_c0_g1_i1.p1 TRINITY_DN60826_c0_g1~~TRINITY_DN60826_c0_g1_i1.p1  ORF type:complete len:371 (+),score=47.54 TRINITY_DN60826_c0_g1_i1:245-1357(+)